MNAKTFIELRETFCELILDMLKMMLTIILGRVFLSTAILAKPQ